MNTISYWLCNDNEFQAEESEKCISNIINYHICRLNLQEKSETNMIEVRKLKSHDNKIYPILKKNDTEKTIKYPILSCIVFLTDSELPFIMTDIDIDNYKYKEFKNCDTINVIFPKKNTHVVFNGKSCNGFIIPKDTNIENPINAILINVWDDDSNHKNENDTEKDNDELTIEKNEKSKITDITELSNQRIWSNDFLNYKMFNNLLYIKKYAYEDIEPILELYNKYISNNWYVITKSEINLKNMYKNIHNELNIHNRFLQRFHIIKFLSPNTCEWLINTAIKNKQMVISKINDTNLSSSISVLNKNILMMENSEMKSFTGKMLEAVCDKVNESYNINNTNNTNNQIEIKDILLVQYNKNNTKNNGLKIYSSNTNDITVEIMLSLLDENSVKEGQLIFNDGLNTILNQGDMVIYSNMVECSVNKILSSDTKIIYKIIIHMKINTD
uniref:Uncharacterized protein n=1 Tax=viral metagenome TaxID=1070528 RepID=A0A6C0CV51_9ZZZZ